MRAKRGPTKEISLKGSFIHKLLNNRLASCSSLNIDCLLLHTVHFDKIFILPLFDLATFVFLLSVFFLHFKQ